MCDGVGRRKRADQQKDAALLVYMLVSSHPIKTARV